ncbi:hypothetical protein DFH06DRAFT_1180464 [Mycena polygramma]|nr:hypothetical protein DFH06DRAFT_1180464 [Mycena polygramma]
MSKNRKAMYKAAPTAKTSVLESQELRRRKALDEQKRRRAQRVDSARQLDLFAGLNLGQSDDEEDTEDPGVVRMGIAAYAPLLPSSIADVEAVAPDTRMEASVSNPEPRKKKRRKPKSKKDNAPNKKFADQCMYAELLEMSEDNSWGASADGLPEDLETGWVAVAPVPVGKRCLAVTDQSLGVPGLVPNTSLRSRKLGKLLMPRFPSVLPPLTILDCILDDNWRDNGILHILDVVKWKGQDIGDCETPFRFWWRDTRLGELTPSPLPSSAHYNQPFDPAHSNAPLSTYRFPYPTKFLPVPYHTDTSFVALTSHIVPLARASRFVGVDVPVSVDTMPAESTMVVDQLQSAGGLLTTKTAEVCADGLLLYISEASYEAGTSPLSSWIPIVKYEEDRIPDADGMTDANAATDGPLDVFHRLVQQRIGQSSSIDSSLQMDVVP